MGERSWMKLFTGVLLLIWIITMSFLKEPTTLYGMARFIQARIAAYNLGTLFILMYYIDAKESNG